MAKYIPVGAPVNRAEEEGLRQLRDALPDDYVVIGNFELDARRRRNTLEFDGLVVGEWGLWAVEIKGWSGKIRGDLRRWQLPWGRVENPFIRIETKAKALRDLLVRRVEGWPEELFCEAVVMLPKRKVRVSIDDPRTERLVLRGQARQFFVDRASGAPRGEAVRLSLELRERIVSTLVPMARERTRTPSMIGEYVIGEEVEREEMPWREYIGHHELLRSRGKVRIKAYTMDPLIPPARRDEEIARVLRDMEALNSMEGNPYVARAYELIRDREDELIFYMVTESVSKRTLRDVFDELEGPCHKLFDPGERQWRWRVGWHLVDAVASLHRRKVSHRNLHPGVVYMVDRDQWRVPFKIADFDFAHMGYFDRRVDQLRSMIKHGYGAPEMWMEEDVADRRADVYSLGAILFELLAGEPLYTPELALLRHEEIWARRRPLLAEEATRGLFDRLLAYQPEDRLEDLGELLELFGERAGQGWQRPRTGDFRLG